MQDESDFIEISKFTDLVKNIIHNFKKLKIWIKSMDLVTEIYRLTNTYPKFEVYNLCSQTQRSAISIPLNISEGSA